MLPRRIALRYLLSKMSHGVVNVISAISVAGVAIATAAIVVVLSVFNGFSQLAASHYSLVDPELRITPAAGNVIANADTLALQLESLNQVDVAMPALEQRGLLIAGESQLAVVFKGVTPRYAAVVSIDSVIIDGYFTAPLPQYPAPTLAAVGVAARMGLTPGRMDAELYVPRRVGRINPANPAGAFERLPLLISGITQVDQIEYDADRLIIPLDSARRILNYHDGEATSIELLTNPEFSISEASEAVAKLLGEGFIIEDRDRQQSESFRMIAVEKWITFAMLIFILIIATFNIISTLSLMVIEKHDNMDTLRALGASKAMVRRIFMLQGAIITAVGGLAGCMLGLVLALAQQWGGFIKLAGDPSKMTITVYPVKVEFTDILAVLAIVAAVAFVTAQITRIFSRKIS